MIGLPAGREDGTMSATNAVSDFTLMEGALRPPLDEVTTVSVFQHFVVYGGWITWFVLIPLSVLTIALAIHYLFTVRRGTQTPDALARTLKAGIQRGRVGEMLELTAGDDTMLGRAAFAGLSQVGSGRDAARAAIDEAVEERAMNLLRRIEYLNVIGNISPMIGLLGTVLGMIQAFSRIFAAGGGMPEAGKLAGDIAVALVTTFWGILIAIPALTAFALFRNRVDTYAAEVVKLCDGLLSRDLRMDHPARGGSETASSVRL
jgi:biopolymer transport protein ExbB